MKGLIIFLMIICVILGFLAIINTFRLNKLKQKCKRKSYHTPKLSSLHGKDFSDYIDYLTRDL